MRRPRSDSYKIPRAPIRRQSTKNIFSQKPFLRRGQYWNKILLLSGRSRGWLHSILLGNYAKPGLDPAQFIVFFLLLAPARVGISIEARLASSEYRYFTCEFNPSFFDESVSNRYNASTTSIRQFVQINQLLCFTTTLYATNTRETETEYRYLSMCRM